MSLWGVHIGIAVIITTLIVGYFRLSRFDRWGLVFVSGVFATVPDWWWFFTGRFFPVSRFRGLLGRTERVHDSLLANLFWFHGVIDTVGTDDVLSSVLVASSSVAVFLLMEYHLSSGHTGADGASDRIR